MLKIKEIIIDENEILYVKKQTRGLEIMFKNGKTKVFNFITKEAVDDIFEGLFEILQQNEIKKFGIVEKIEDKFGGCL